MGLLYLLDTLLISNNSFFKTSVIFLLHLVKECQSKNTSIERFRKWVHMAATALEICDREKIY